MENSIKLSENVFLIDGYKVRKQTTRRYLKNIGSLYDEVFCLIKLEKYDIAPKLLSVDVENRIVEMTYIGNMKPLSGESTIDKGNDGVLAFAKALYTFESILSKEDLQYNDWKAPHIFYENGKVTVVDYDAMYDARSINDDTREGFRIVNKRHLQLKYAFLASQEPFMEQSFKDFKEELKRIIRRK